MKRCLAILRFAVESLSWEKWSVFSHNRCQEEIEKFKAPGIVAQKKAYFEEYYKRIRELKALQREQDRQDTAAALGSGGDGGVCSKGGEEHNAEADDTAIASSIRNPASLKNDSVYKEAVVTSAKNNVTADHRSKGDRVKSSQGFKHPLGKPADRAENSVNSRKTTSSKDVPNNSSTSMSSNRHFMETHSNTMVPLPSLLSKERQASGSNRTRDDVPGHSDSKASNRLAKLPGHRKKMSHSQIAVSSDRPLKEVRSNITVPRPFTFSTEKRAAAPTRTRDSSQSHSVSKASNRLDQPTGHKESMPYVQNTSVEIAVKGGMRGTSLATRRSINPHLKGHLNQQRGHEPSPRSSLTSNDMGKKQIEVKEEPEFRRFPQSLKSVGSQLPSFSKNGTPKSGHRKLQIIPSRCADKKGGQKSRQGMPCWR